MQLAFMGYITIRKTSLQTRLARVQSILASYYALQAEAAVQGISSYKFDSGEGSQSATRKSTAEIALAIERYEAEEDHYINELYNMGIISMQLRRKCPC
jgi:CHASE3 domain sensor protein